MSHPRTHLLEDVGRCVLTCAPFEVDLKRSCASTRLGYQAVKARSSGTLLPVCLIGSHQKLVKWRSAFGTAEWHEMTETESKESP